MRITTRVSRSGEALSSRVERLKERQLRERSEEVQSRIRRVRREDAVSETTVAPGSRR
jgi:pyruvate/oxaloacetate carboxyltransferase